MKNKKEEIKIILISRVGDNIQGSYKFNQT